MRIDTSHVEGVAKMLFCPRKDVIRCVLLVEEVYLQ